MHYFLLELEPATHSMTVRGYQARDLSRATDEYMAIERALDSNLGADAVLVSVESVAALRRAYPNYFLDTTAFLEAMHTAID